MSCGIGFTCWQLDSTKIEANLKDGVLRLRIPKAEEAKPRGIEVTVGCISGVVAPPRIDRYGGLCFMNADHDLTRHSGVTPKCRQKGDNG
jgi:hypothetical protein